MLECTVTYVNNTPYPSAVQIGKAHTSANETNISDCLFLNSSQSPPGTGATALEIVAADEVRVDGVLIEGFQQGITVVPTAVQAAHLFFADVRVQTTSDSGTVGAALLVQPQSALVAHLQCVGCRFEPDATYGTSYTSAGVYIDASASGGIIDQVRFVSCYSCTWPGAGMQIIDATNVEILGGCYSCNATLPESPPTSEQAGIVISDAASGVRIIGAACNNAIEGQPASQHYGVSLLGSGSQIPSNIFIRGCDLVGNLSSAIDVLFGNPVEVTNCAGYNDQGRVLSTTFSGTSPIPIKNVLYQYYGPIAFYLSGGSLSVAIAGNSTGLTSGGFVLGPGESAEMTWTTLPSSFLVVGK
jgi:hypothetical protein